MSIHGTAHGATHGTAGADAVVDGRRARRERGRRAVIDAAIDVVLETGRLPSADELVERAGVSQASLFRYFTTLDELRGEAIGRYLERFDDLIAIPSIGAGPLADRIVRFVAARDAFYDRAAPIARLARRLSVDVVELAETLERVRSTLADQVAQHFGPELSRLDAPDRGARVAVVAALSSFEAWDQLGVLGVAGRRTALCAALADLLDD